MALQLILLQGYFQSTQTNVYSIKTNKIKVDVIMKRIVNVILLVAVTMCIFTGCSSKVVETAYTNLELEKYIKVNSNYLDFTYEKPNDIIITDDEVESAIKLALAEASEETENPDGLTKDGDKLEISYVAEDEDGNVITQSNGYSITLGKAYLQEELQSALIGHALGDTVEVTTKISDDFAYEESLQGKTVIYKITINKKYDVTEPALNDDFVKEHSTAKSVDEYRELVKQQLMDSKMEDALTEIFDEYWSKIVDEAEVIEYPQEMLDSEEDYFYGYMNYLGYSEADNDYGDAAAEYAKEAVKQKLVLYQIASEQELIPTEDEFREYATAEIESNGYNEESFKETFIYDSYTYGLEYGWIEDYLNDAVKKVILKL